MGSMSYALLNIVEGSQKWELADFGMCKGMFVDVLAMFTCC
jgi:hypothetical protein